MKHHGQISTRSGLLVRCLCCVLVLWRTAGLSQGLPQVSTCKGTTMSEPAPIHTGNRGVGVWCGSEVW